LGIFLSYGGAVLLFGLPMLLLAAHMLVRAVLEKDAGIKKRALRRSMGRLFCLYVIAMLALLFLNRNQREGPLGLQFVNLVPFRTIWGYLQAQAAGATGATGATGAAGNAAVNLGGNLLAFAPMGVFVPFLFGGRIRKLWQFALLVAGVVLAVECVQFFTQVGSADIDDVLLNTLGAVGVYWVYKRFFVK
jgi:glycopeptide antibiotics resistance protein